MQTQGQQAALHSDVAAIFQPTFQGPARSQHPFIAKVAAELELLSEALRDPTKWDPREQFGIEVEYTLTSSEGRPVFDAAFHNLTAECTSGSLLVDKELLRSNLEGKSLPRQFGAGFLHGMRQDFIELAHKADRHVSIFNPDASTTLCGILPSYTLTDCSTVEILSSGERYLNLNRSIMERRNGEVNVLIAPALAEHIYFTSSNMTFEGTPTSVQYHYSVTPDRFVDLYSAGLVALAPVMAVGANSPILFGQQGWKETRIALLESGTTPERFIFGESWPSTVEEIFAEIVKHEPLLPDTQGSAELDADNLPNLCKHRGTVWNWLRACYGYDPEHGPHLRTEMRVLGAGPTEVDMAANAALYYGLTTYLMNHAEQIRTNVEFQTVKSSFYEAAKFGLDAELQWIDGKRYKATELVLGLLPMAEAGLKEMGVPKEEADFYLNIIQERVEKKQAGADWIIQSLANLEQQMPSVAKQDHLNYLSKCMKDLQQISRSLPSGLPVANWPLASYTGGH